MIEHIIYWCQSRAADSRPARLSATRSNCFISRSSSASSWSNPSRCNVPWTVSRASSSPSDTARSLAPRAATGNAITISPRSADPSGRRRPSKSVLNDSTSVAASSPRNRRLSVRTVRAFVTRTATTRGIRSLREASVSCTQRSRASTSTRWTKASSTRTSTKCRPAITNVQIRRRWRPQRLRQR